MLLVVAFSLTGILVKARYAQTHASGRLYALRVPCQRLFGSSTQNTRHRLSPRLTEGRQLFQLGVAVRRLFIPSCSLLLRLVKLITDHLNASLRLE